VRRQPIAAGGPPTSGTISRPCGATQAVATWRHAGAACFGSFAPGFDQRKIPVDILRRAKLHDRFPGWTIIAGGTPPNPPPLRLYATRIWGSVQIGDRGS
jgi:hypothetical protein